MRKRPPGMLWRNPGTEPSRSNRKVRGNGKHVSGSSYPLWLRAAIAVTVIAVIVHATATPVAGIGIAVPVFVPVVATAILGLVLSREYAAPLAYIGHVFFELRRQPSGWMATRRRIRVYIDEILCTKLDELPVVFPNKESTRLRVQSEERLQSERDHKGSAARFITRHSSRRCRR